MTTSIEHSSIPELHEKLIAAVRQLGYRVTEIDEPIMRMSVSALADKVGRRGATVSQMLSRGAKGSKLPHFQSARGPKGRLLWIEPTPELIEFLTIK